MDDANNGNGGEGAPDQSQPNEGQLKPLPLNFLTQRAIESSGQFSVTPNVASAVPTTTLNGLPVITNPTLGKPKADLDDLKMQVETLTSYSELLKENGRLREEFGRIDKSSMIIDENLLDSERELVEAKSQEIADLLQENDEHPTTEALTEIDNKIAEFKALVYQLDELTQERIRTAQIKGDDTSTSLDNQADVAPNLTPEDEATTGTQEAIEQESFAKEITKLVEAFDLIKGAATELIPRIKKINKAAALSIGDTLQEIKRRLYTLSKTPQKELIDSTRDLINDFNDDVRDGEAIVFGAETALSDIPKTVAAPSAAPTPEPKDASAPKKQEVSPLFNEAQIRITKPRNLYYKREINKTLITGVGDKRIASEVLKSEDANIWLKIRYELKRYTDFIATIKSADANFYAPLIEMKMDIIDAIEQARFGDADALGPQFSEMLTKAERGEFKTPESKIDLTPETPMNRRAAVDIRVKNIKFNKTTNKWMVGDKVMNQGDYQLWMSIRSTLENYQRFISPNGTARNFSPLVNLKVDLVNALEQADFAKANDIFSLFQEELNRSVDIQGDVQRYNLEQLKKGYALENDTTTFAYLKMDMQKNYLKIDRNTGDWVRTSPEEEKVIWDARTALVNFTLRASTPKGIIDKKNKIIQSINDYKFADAAKATEEYMQEFGQLNKLSLEELPPEYWPETAGTGFVQTPQSAMSSPDDATSSATKIESDPSKTLESLYQGGVISQFGFGDPNAVGKDLLYEWFDRKIVLARVGSGILPFYCSLAGTGGKTQGNWYPFFGVYGNWIIKSSRDDLENGYNIPEIQTAQKILNEQLGNIIGTQNIATEVGFPFDEPFLKKLNELVGDPLPTKDNTEDRGIKSSERIASILKRLGLTPVSPSTPGAQVSVPGAVSGAGGRGAPPVPPTTPPTTTPPSPEGLPMRRDVVGGWPITVYRKEIGGSKTSKGRIEWYRVDENKVEKPLQNSNEWNTFYDEFGDIFKEYRELMLSGRLIERTKKEGLFITLIDAKNEVIAALKQGDLSRAQTVTDTKLKVELMSAQEEWGKVKTKDEEELKKSLEKEKSLVEIRKTFEEKKKEVAKLKAQAALTKQGDTTDESRQHIEREEREVEARFNDAEISLNSDSFNKDLITYAYEGLDQFAKTLTGYEERAKKLAGAAPRQTVLRDSVIGGNKDQVVKRLGRPDMKVDEWIQDQENIKRVAEGNRRMDAIQTNINELYPKHDKEFADDPLSYYISYILDNKRGILEPNERMVVDDTIKIGLASGLITQDQINTVSRNYALNKQQAGARTATGMSTQTYSPAVEDRDKAAQKQNRADMKEIKGMSDQKILERIDAGTATATTPDGVAGFYPARTGGMVSAARTPNAIPAGGATYNPGATPRTSDPNDPILTTAPGGLPPEPPETPPTTPTQPERTPSQAAENKLRIVGKVIDKLQSFDRRDWRSILTPFIVGGIVTVGALYAKSAGEEKALEQANALSGEADKRIKPESWKGYLQTPESKEMLQDFYTMTNENIIKKYFSSKAISSNPESIAQALSYDAYAILYDHDPNLYGLTEPQRKELSKFLIVCQQISQATYAVMMSNQTLGAAGVLKGSYTLPVYGDKNPENIQNDSGYITPQVTVEKFINQVKARMHKRDEEEERAKKLAVPPRKI